ncbi:hypothetical protein MRX96_022742 [Rhipicephalus microplus]
MCAARVLRRAGFFAPPSSTHTPCAAPLASPESLAAVEAAVPSSAVVARKKNNRAAAALEDYVVGGVAAHRLRRRGAPRCGRSDDVRAPPASIGGGPTSSALPFGLHRGVAVVSACGVLLVVVRRVWPYVPFVGAGERWIFVVRSVDRAAGPKRRRKAHDRSPVPARGSAPTMPGSSAACEYAHTVATVDVGRGERVEREAGGTDARDVTTWMVAIGRDAIHVTFNYSVRTLFSLSAD